MQDAPRHDMARADPGAPLHERHGDAPAMADQRDDLGRSEGPGDAFHLQREFGLVDAERGVHGEHQFDVDRNLRLGDGAGEQSHDEHGGPGR